MSHYTIKSYEVFTTYDSETGLARHCVTLEDFNNLIEAMNKQADRLQAEVERLRKAGDEMDAYLKRQDGTTNGMISCREAWLTAKEGRDAK